MDSSAFSSIADCVWEDVVRQGDNDDDHNDFLRVTTTTTTATTTTTTATTTAQRPQRLLEEPFTNIGGAGYFEMDADPPAVPDGPTDPEYPTVYTGTCSEAPTRTGCENFGVVCSS